MRLQNPILLWFSQLQIRIFTLLNGKKVGSDHLGNRYYTERKPRNIKYHRRWVLFQCEPEASRVPPEWYGWLHHMMDEPLGQKKANYKSWIKPHQENKTGTTAAYFPKGHLYAGGRRAMVSSDYESWKP